MAKVHQRWLGTPRHSIFSRPKTPKQEVEALEREARTLRNYIELLQMDNAKLRVLLGDALRLKSMPKSGNPHEHKD